LNKDLNAGIEFLGVIKEFRNKLLSNDIFIMPSRAETEGFPISLVEAGLTENLVITSDFKGVDCVFEDGKDGLMFKVDDAPELAEKIMYAIDNFQDMKLLARNFRDKILREFDYDTMIKKTLELFEEAVKK
jgi:Glycosyltransferase